MMKTKDHTLVTVLLSVLFLFVSNIYAVVYVDATAPMGGNGISWSTAYRFLQDALYDPGIISGAQSQIWVAAQGTYNSDLDEGGNVTVGSRAETFQLINGVALYGGFPSGGGTWEDRDPNSNVTILSGHIGPNPSHFSYHVVTGSGTDGTAVLDGFTITAGNADSASLPDGAGGGCTTTQAVRP